MITWWLRREAVWVPFLWSLFCLYWVPLSTESLPFLCVLFYSKAQSRPATNMAANMAHKQESALGVDAGCGRCVWVQRQCKQMVMKISIDIGGRFFSMIGVIVIESSPRRKISLLLKEVMYHQPSLNTLFLCFSVGEFSCSDVLIEAPEIKLGIPPFPHQLIVFVVYLIDLLFIINFYLPNDCR